MTDITIEDLSELIGEFAKSSAYRAKDPDSKLQAFMQRCILLANLDYVHTIVNNHCGELSAHYPSHLIVLENEKSHNQNDPPPSTHPPTSQPPPKKATETIYESVNEGKKLENENIDEKINNIDETKNNSDEKKNNIDETKNNIDEKINNIDETKNNSDDKKNNIDETKNIIDEKKNNIDETKNIIDEKKNNIDETKNIIDEKKNNIGETKNIIDEKKNNIGETESNKDEIESNKDETETNKDEIKSNKDETETNKDETKNNKDEKTNDKDETKNNIDKKKDDKDGKKNKNKNDNDLQDIIRKARFARCRSRFPLPVILYKGKYICRSATLSSGPEIYGRHGLLYIFGNTESNDIINDVTSSDVDKAEIHLNEWQLYDRVRQCDIQLLKALNVGTIIDFMVEKKKVKFGMNVTSSEKVDKEKRYAEFRIIPLPYPGCEFFREFRENDYLAGGLFFNWAQNHVDAEICVPTDSIATSLGISWDSYRNWDLVNLTQNYLKLILRYLHDSNTGLLVHCISGWDRTPLFISLLRISLWADGVIHTSLNASQMLYYTVAYDWMLFGHDLQDRLAKGEDIFYFCFYFLKHILSEDFSVSSRARHVSRNDSDSQLDNVMFENDSLAPLSTVSSNLSLNSCCSNNSQNSRDSQDNNPPSVFHCANIDDKEDAQSNGNVPQNHFNNVHWGSSPNKDILTSAATMAAASRIASPSSAIAISMPPLTSASSTSAAATTNFGGTRSPLPTTNRTSPVAVPVPGRMRQRNESSSSGGSWQMISTTGSLRGTTSASTTPMSDMMGANSITTSQESNSTLIDDESMIVNPATQRADRLTSLRNKFYKVYTTTVGLRLKDQSDCGIGQMIGNLAEKVLSIQRNSSSGT